MPRFQRWKALLDHKEKEFTFFSRDNVFVRCKEEFCVEASIQLSQRVELSWEKTLAEASRSKRCIPYDAPKFRLADICCEDEKIFLNVGITSYKDYIAFRTDPSVRNLAKEIAKKRKIPYSNLLPNVIGNAAIVHTIDGQIIIIKRNRRVSSYRNYFDLPGGHPEPSHINVFFDNERIQNNRIEGLIHNELFDSIKQEVQDELRVPMNALGQPKIMTILVNLCDVMTPDIVFIQPVYLEAERIKYNFNKTNNQNSEIQRLEIFDPKTKKTSEFQKQTPIMEGAFATLYSINALLGEFIWKQ